MKLAVCIGCGCHDLDACLDHAGDACSWLAVDREAGIGVCSECEEHLARWNAGDRSGPVSHAGRAEALATCLDVLLRMIPEYQQAEGTPDCTDIEHDMAIRRAAVQLYGPDRSTWPDSIRAASQGEFA